MKARAAQVLLAGVVAAAGIGFLAGTAAPPPRPPLVASVVTAEAAPMPSYLGQRSRAKADSTWARDVSALRAAEGPAPEETVADRYARRAYDGAPPTIPHAIAQGDAPECLACHEDGLRVRGRNASPIPHDRLTSCTQCHVPEAAPQAAWSAQVGNRFAGLRGPARGARAWAGAPPTIPHGTSMRGTCLSCHGPYGHEPIVTPHPERQSCQQCHAPSAGFDQAPGGL